MKQILFGSSPIAVGLGGVMLLTYQYTHFEVSISDTLTFLGGLATIIFSAVFYMGKRLKSVEARLTTIESEMEPCKCGTVEDRMDEILGRFEARMQTQLTDLDLKLFKHVNGVQKSK